MIDFIKIETEIIDYSKWRNQMPFEINTPINTETGEILCISKTDNLNRSYKVINRTANFNAYTLELCEVLRDDRPSRVYLKINGSPHVNKYQGQNYQRFYYSDLKEEIMILCELLKIDSRKAKISNLEFGVNVEVDFAPSVFIQKSLVNYKNIPFNHFGRDRRGKRLGCICDDTTHYFVKCYDKGLQYDLSYNLMRFELKYKIMQKLKNEFNITHLYDLTEYDNLYNLKKLLLKAWDDILLFEPVNTGQDKLTRTQQRLMVVGNNDKYWTELSNEVNGRYSIKEAY
jgi:hypothetical protein